LRERRDKGEGGRWVWGGGGGKEEEMRRKPRKRLSSHLIISNKVTQPVFLFTLDL